MDEALLEQLRKLAKEEGFDAEDLIQALSGTPMPEDLERAVEVVLGDVELFDLALKKLKGSEQ